MESYSGGTAPAGETMSRDEAVRRYREWAKQPNVMDFMPHDGICYKCDRDVVIGHEESFAAGSMTGCPRCGESYCD